MNKNPDVLRLLISADAAVDAQDEKEQTALMLAAAAGTAETIRLLLDANAEVNATTSWGWCALYSAVGNPDAEVLRLLLEAGAAAKVNVPTDDGTTALMFAVGASENIDTIRLLLDAGADTSAKDAEGKTVLDHLAFRKEAELADLPADLAQKLSAPTRAPVVETVGHLTVNRQAEVAYPKFGTAADNAIRAVIEASIENGFPKIDGDDANGKLKISYQTFRPSPEVASIVFTYRYDADESSSTANRTQIKVDVLNVVLDSGDLLFPDSLFGDLDKAVEIFSRLAPKALKENLRRDTPDLFVGGADSEKKIDEQIRAACEPQWENFSVLSFEPHGARIYFQPGQAAKSDCGVLSAFIPKAYLAEALVNPQVWEPIQPFAFVKELQDDDELAAIVGKYQLNLVGEIGEKKSDAPSAFLLVPLMYPLTLEVSAAVVDPEGELHPDGEPLTKLSLGDSDAMVLRLELSDIPSRAVSLTYPESAERRVWFPRYGGADGLLILDDGFIPFALPIPETISESPIARGDLLIIQDNLLKLWMLDVREIDGAPDNATLVKKTLLSFLLANAAAPTRELAVKKEAVEQAALELFGYPISEHFAPDGAALKGGVYYIEPSMLKFAEDADFADYILEPEVKMERLAEVRGAETQTDGSCELRGVVRCFKTDGNNAAFLWAESEFTARVRRDADNGKWRLIYLKFVAQAMG